MEYPLQPWSLKVYINVYTLVRLHKKSTNTVPTGTKEPTLQKKSFTGLNITVLVCAVPVQYNRRLARWRPENRGFVQSSCLLVD